MRAKFNKTYKRRIKYIKKFFKRVWEVLCQPEIAILPGQLAFFVMLSLVPIITLIGYGASFFGISIDTIINLLKDNFSSGVAEMMIPIISGEVIDFKLVIMFIIMFYIASNGANSIIIVSNEIYNVKQSSWIKRRLKAIFLTIAIVTLILFLLLVPAFGTKIIDAVDYFNIKSTLTNILEIMQGPISWVIIFIFIKVIYTISPDKALPSSRLNIGTAFTTVGWVIITELYSYYVNNFAHYDIFYAGLSNIAVLMLWIYFLSYIFVIGISLNSKVELEELEITGSI
ncbi:MAG: YihY/virulence factor BrkB family protein [Bacilli bacterium]|nr:YihY/virulence factor BrkB family protein [Bacilli bacterium]MDD3896103.1 YihY/virulence factor BrkB family protein [Bacilli bacterium]MDD4407922.1 YihY/virulence factor BrkB family protein [Bacilli bacterium]